MGSQPCHHTNKSSRISANPRLAIRDATKPAERVRFRNGATMIRCKRNPSPRKIGVASRQNVHGEKGYRTSDLIIEYRRQYGQASVGKVEDPHDPKCKGEPNSEQGIYASQEKTADENLNQFKIALIFRTWILVPGGGDLRRPDNMVLSADDLGRIGVDGSHAVFGKAHHTADSHDFEMF